MGILVLALLGGLAYVATRKKPGAEAPSLLTSALDLAEREKKADVVNAIVEVEETKAAEAIIKGSPLPGATPAQFWDFFRRMRRFPLGDVVKGPKEDYFGSFHLGTRTLGDLGVMTVHRAPDGRYVGSWKVTDFLTSAKSQYLAWLKLAQEYRAVIVGRHGSVIGTTVDGTRLSLSGLLGLAMSGGLATLAKWLESPADRKPETTALLRRYNGVF